VKCLISFICLRFRCTSQQHRVLQEALEEEGFLRGGESANELVKFDLNFSGGMADASLRIAVRSDKDLARVDRVIETIRGAGIHVFIYSCT